MSMWGNSITGAVPGAADRLDIGRDRPSKSEGRRTLPQQSPDGCLGQLSPYLERSGHYFGEVNMKGELTYVGIDIAKERVDVAIRPSGQIWSLPYDDTEMEELVQQLQEVMPAAVILEATGGIELPLLLSPMRK